MDGLRLAALKLYGAAPSDRAWILSQFDRRTRRHLNGLLKDLRKSGIDSETVSDLAQSELALPEPEDLRVELADGAPGLDAADPRAVERALAGEPGWVISAVVNAHAWSWREPVVKRLRRKKILGRSSPQASPKPAVVSALVEALAKKVKEGSKFDELMDGPVRGGALALWTRWKEWIT
jgi:hypothetical protein